MMKIVKSSRLDGSELLSDLFLQNTPSNSLAIILPGGGYSCSAPLLYYASNGLIELGFDVLNVNYDVRFYPKKSERMDFIINDIQKACELVLTSQYKKIIFVAMSIGTRALARFIKKETFIKQSVQDHRFVWLSPAFDDQETFQTIKNLEPPSMVVIGTKDPIWDKEKLRSLRIDQSNSVLEVHGADHGLDIDGSVMDSITVMGNIQKELLQFFKFPG